MNAGVETEDTIVRYYDGDYPSAVFGEYPENVDDVTEYQGVRHDVDRYRAAAKEHGGPILELCCGTGRVAIPLARDGHHVTAVDLSAVMLDRFRQNLEREPRDVCDRIELIEQDITKLSLEGDPFGLATIAFNSLLCIPKFEDQCRALHAVAAHLAPGATLLLDIINPLTLGFEGNSTPSAFFTRRSPAGGNTYTRFACRSSLDDQQRQRLFGWYDEVDPDGIVHRRQYSMWWRPIFRYEAELMLQAAGFETVALHGGSRGEPFTAKSPHMFFEAKKRATPGQSGTGGGSLRITAENPAGGGHNPHFTMPHQRKGIRAARNAWPDFL